LWDVIALSSLSKSVVSTILHVGEVALLVTSMIVVIGLVGEARKSWVAWHHVFAMLVIVGVAGELISDGLIFTSSDRLQTIQETEISHLNRGTEELRTKNLVLEAQVAPRRLTDDEENEIASFLRSLTGRKVIIASYAFDIDGTVLADQIKDTLFGRRILSVVNQIGAHIPAHAPIIQGINVSGNDPQLVSALKEALRSLGKLELDPSLTAPGQELLDFNPVPDAGATIFVGARPITTTKGKNIGQQTP